MGAGRQGIRVIESADVKGADRTQIAEAGLPGERCPALGAKRPSDARKFYSSSPGVGRAFCPECGTPLTWETGLGDLGPVCAIHISTFDDPDALMPSALSFYPEKISWFDIADTLPR